MYAALPSSRVNTSAPLVCRHDRVTREAERVDLLRSRSRRVGLVEGIRGGGDIE